MPKLYDVYFAIKETVAEFEVVLGAVNRYRAGMQNAQPGFTLPEGTEPHHLDKAADELEATYLIRLWEVFETAWSSYWRYRTNRPDGKIKAFSLVE